MSELIRLAEAAALIRQQLPALDSERVPLQAAIGRLLGGDIYSPIALPSFDHAAMDGYALRADQPLAAGLEHRVRGSHAAGDAVTDAAAGAGDACEIMTGAALPTGLDAVVAVERTQLLQAHADGTPARIRLLDTLRTGDNVRRRGSDVAEAAPALAAGTRIGPPQLMLLAALGVAQVAVVRRARVAIICTGKELQDDLTQPLAEGRIHNSNGPYLLAALTAAGAQVLSCDSVDDSATTFATALQRALDAGADLVVSTGAVSMGRYDFVPDVLRRQAAQLLFHKLAIRPGKPLLCARLVSGPLIFALPGTPMAVAAGMRFVLAPALRAMAGQADEPALHALLDTPQQPKPGLRHFLRGSLRQHADGSLRVQLHSQQQPFRIRPFAEADVWVVLPEDASDCAAGARVQIASLDAGTPPRIQSAAGFMVDA